MNKVDSENREKKQKKDGMLQTQTQFLMFDDFFSKLNSTGKTRPVHHSM